MEKNKSDEKKKLIRIACDRAMAESYEHVNMNFAFVTSPENGREQCTKIMSCRENVNKTVSTVLAVRRANEAENKEQDPKQIDFEKLRLLIVKSINPKGENLANFRERLFSGKALINRYEEMMDWPTSKITTVKHKYYDTAWLLTGPKQWMSQPQLLAVATYFIRLMSIHGPLEVDTFEQAETSLRKLYDDYIKEKNKKDSDGSKFTYYSDIEAYLTYLDEITLLIKKSEEIFKGISLDDAWKYIEGRSSIGVQSGLLSFFGNNVLNYNDIAQKAKDTFNALKE